MLVITSVTQSPSRGHPLWHLLVVAGAAIAVFVGIKAKEYRDHNLRPRRANRARHASGPTAEHQSAEWHPPTIPALALAVLSFASAAIHASVTSEHFHEALIYGAFFLVASAAQAAWAVLIVRRANRTLLIVGAAGNAAVIALWTLTRTVGLPIGPEPWHPESVGAADLASTFFELVLVLTAAILLARKARERPNPRTLPHQRGEHRGNDSLESLQLDAARLPHAAVRPPVT
jgi:hypothetical protein